MTKSKTEIKALYACPCCEYLTLPSRGQYNICPVCFWEDDGAQHPDDFSMPNHMFLVQGQANFKKLGACDERAVSLVKKEAKLAYKKQDYHAINQGQSLEQTNAFAEFFNKLNDEK